MTSSFRLATSADVPTLEALDREVVAYHHTIDPTIWASADEYPAGYFEKFWTEQIASPTARVFLLLNGEEVVGLFLARIEESTASMRFAKRGVVDRVYVRKEHRGKGSTRVGLEVATKWFREEDVATIDLHVEARNELGIAVWKKLGFEPYVIKMKKAT